jgi:Protein of unknown function (DUF3089)
LIYNPDIPGATTRTRRASLAGAVALLIGFIGVPEARAQSANTETAAPADYSDSAKWLCRPGRADPCAANLDATLIAEDGSMTVERFHAAPDPPIDCFYVYPTVSREPTGNADFAVDADLTRTVILQFARFGARCRLFAPVYRQITIPALVALFSGKTLPFNRELPYQDVLSAWRNYLANDNHGRGFVLVGHSQGTDILARLVREEIDGKPIQAQMVSGMLTGGPLGAVRVADGDAAAMAFPHIAVCHANADIGCVIGFSSFRVEAPPPPGGLFEKTPPGTHPVCANPAALGGGAAPLDAYLTTSGATITGSAHTPVVWTDPPHAIDTPFVKVPGLLSAACAEGDKVVYLAVSRHPGQDGRRANDFSGDLFGPDGRPLPNWGLHLVDIDLTIGNLVEIMGEETRAYLARMK